MKTIRNQPVYMISAVSRPQYNLAAAPISNQSRPVLISPIQTLPSNTKTNPAVHQQPKKTQLDSSLQKKDIETNNQNDPEKHKKLDEDFYLEDTKYDRVRVIRDTEQETFNDGVNI